MDLNPLLRLKENLLQIHENTSAMQSKMRNFENRLGSLDEKMRPIQDATEHLSRAKRNITLAVVEIERTHEYFRISSMCYDVINAGIKTQRYAEFFDAMERLASARKFFIAHREIKSSGTAIMNIDQLLKRALNMCLAEMQSLLERCGDAVEFTEGAYQGVNPMEDEIAKSFHEVCVTLNNNSELGYFDAYSNVRIYNIRKQLDSSLVQLGITSPGAGKGLLAMDAIAPTNVPYVPGSHPLQQYYTLVVEILRGEQLMWAFAFPNDSSDENLKCFANIVFFVVNELAQVLAAVSRDPKESAKRSGVLSQSNALLLRLDLMDLLLSRFEELKEHSALGGAQPKGNQNDQNRAYTALMQLRGQMVEVTMSSATDMLEGVIMGMGPLSSAQDTCDLHPVTGHVLHTAKELAVFKSVYGRIFLLFKEAAMNTKTQVSPLLPPSCNDLIVAMLNNLVECLQANSANFAGLPKVQQSSTPSWYMNMGSHSLFESGEKEGVERLIYSKPKLFLINNLYSIHLYAKDRASATAAKQDLMSTNQDARLMEFFQVVEEELARETELFITCILRAVVLSEDDVKFSRQFENDKVNKAKMLKSMFSAFNGGIAALLSQQPEWRIAYADLRNVLDERIRTGVVAAYTEFYDANSKVNFSKKHMDQYVKYKPSDIAALLANYFQRK